MSTNKSESSSVGRATAFQAVGRGFEPRLSLTISEQVTDFHSFIHHFYGLQVIEKWLAIRLCSSVVEHFLGKEEVGSSILLNGSNKN